MESSPVAGSIFPVDAKRIVPVCSVFVGIIFFTVISSSFFVQEERRVDPRMMMTKANFFIRNYYGLGGVGPSCLSTPSRAIFALIEETFMVLVGWYSGPNTGAGIVGATVIGLKSVLFWPLLFHGFVVLVVGVVPRFPLFLTGVVPRL